MKTRLFLRFGPVFLVLGGLLASVASGFAQKAPYIYIWSPTNNSMYLAPANLTIYVRALGNTNPVQTVQFFVGNSSLGIVTNGPGVLVTNVEPLFPMGWSNVLAGNYALKAVATDSMGLSATSAVVNVSVVTNFPPPRPSVYIYSPTNNSSFLAPATFTIYARAYEATGTVQTVQFYANSLFLGTVSNSSQVVVSNISSAPLFPLTWSNVVAGTYALKAIATDAYGQSGTSQVVNVTIVTNRPPPNVPFTVGFYYPTNGQSFLAPANIGVHAWVMDSNVVRTVQYFANSTNIGIVTNVAGVLLTNTSAANPFFMLWSNVLAGNYALTAVATDSAGILATSAPVNITVVARPPPTNRPPVVRITSPPNAAVFKSPVNLPIYAYATDPDGFVTSVQFFANSNSLGYGNMVPRGTNQPPVSYYTNYFFLVWSNVPPGQYALTAVATDNSNAYTASLPVNITVQPPTVPPTNHYAVVTVSAVDPIAIEGTNCWVWSGLTNYPATWTDWPTGARGPFTNCGPKNATFRIYRAGDTNAALDVTYALGGTASNGVDYVSLPGVATIPAGQRQAWVSVVPIDDGPPDINKTVILKLTPATNSPPSYVIGSTASAAATIVDLPSPTSVPGVMADRTFHLAANGPNGAWFHVEYSTDFLHWTPVCTNQVVNGSIDFLDPDAPGAPARFYRAVPEPNSPP